MSIHKKDLEALLDNFGQTLSKNNLAAVNLVPQMMRSLIAYVEEHVGGTAGNAVVAAAPTVTNVANAAVDSVANVALTEVDTVFAKATVAANLTAHGNATILTDLGQLKVNVEAEVLDGLAKEGIDAASAIANSVVEAIKEDGAKEILAVSAVIAGDLIDGAAPEKIAVDAAAVVVGDVVKEVAKAKAKPATPAKK